VLIIGGGPSGLAAALRLANLQRQQNGAPLSIAVLEKSRSSGAHMLSGAVFDPTVLEELIPDWRSKNSPLKIPVIKDHIYFLTEKHRLRFPVTPPPLRNHGNFVLSLNGLVKWLADLVEESGVDIFTGFSGTEILFDGDRVAGVRTGDRGVDREGKPKKTFEPGVDIRAAVTIFADGVRGNLTKQLIHRFSLDSGRSAQSYALGIRELWEVPEGRIAPGAVIHTLGYPLRMEEFGGGFAYGLSDGRLSIGFVSGLDYRDPLFDPHNAFQLFKQHPLIKDLLKNGQMIRYGAKALPEGGWHSIPRCHVDGALIVGDAAGFVNSLRLKGIHLAMRSGMCAADAAFEAIRLKDSSRDVLARYTASIENGDIHRELYPVRNVHQSFSGGLLAGLSYSALALLTRGWWIKDPMPTEPGYKRIESVRNYYRDREIKVTSADIDRRLTFDKLTSVHYSGTRHDEDQPNHLIVRDTDICRTVCLEEYKNPCTRFCPANVYEIIPVSGNSGGKELKINASNCVHCKTCDIMDPYQIIDWVPPEGGGGPQYEGM